MNNIFASISRPSYFSELHRENGSALLVTILITSISIVLTIALLSRIIPYSQSIRGMEEAMQSYYAARGQVEKGLASFDTAFSKDQSELNVGIIPNLGAAFALASQSTHHPLKLTLYPTEAEVQFGTAPVSSKHRLSKNTGGLTWDLTGFDVSSMNKLELTNVVPTSATGTFLTFQFFKNENGTLTEFISNPHSINPGTTPPPVNLMTLEVKDSLAFKDWITLNGECDNIDTTCFLKLTLSGAASHIDFELESGVAFPDLNSVLIADGFDDRSRYHRRLIEIIPSIQEI